MRPEKKSQLLLGVTRSKAKMLEYGVPEEHHIKITQDPAKLFTLSIGLLGDLAAALNLAATQKRDIVKALKKDRDGANAVMEKYPIYFQERMNELLQ